MQKKFYTMIIPKTIYVMVLQASLWISLTPCSRVL